jgi:hypothetical protein
MRFDESKEGFMFVHAREKSGGRNSVQERLVVVGLIAAGLSLSGQIYAQADDSVVSSKSKVNSKITINVAPTAPGGKGEKDTLRLMPLYKDVPAMASYNFSDAWINYGPFTNTSEFPLTIILQGLQNTQINVAIDGVVRRSGLGTTEFVVPPGSQHFWSTKRELTITALVPLNSTQVRDPKLFGLPRESDFRSPKPIGAYMSCAEIQVVSGGQPPATESISYHYESGQMSDGAHIWGATGRMPQPPSPGQCSVSIRFESPNSDG